jgi:hypothetical protein
MKITLTHNDVLCAVRDFLTNQGFSAPASNTDSFGVFWDESLAQVTVEVSEITIAPPASASSGPAPRAAARVGRFDPLPPPSRERRDEPDRTLDDGGEPLPERINNERDIKGILAQSQDTIRRITDPTKMQHASARDRYPNMQVASSIEDLGKDPNDYKDEI